MKVWGRRSKAALGVLTELLAGRCRELSEFNQSGNQNMARGGKRQGAGRKRGAATKRTSAAANKLSKSGVLPLEILVTAMRDAWKSNDMELACGLARDAAPYFHARVSPKDAPLKLKGVTGTLSEKGEAVLSAMARGEISPGQAGEILSALASQGRIVETTELEKRIAALEQAANTKQNGGRT
jgi:hypothetical protein